MRVSIALGIFLFFNSIQAFAQDSSRFTIGILYAPEIGYRTISSDDSAFNAIMVTYRDAVEKPGYGYRLGGTISYRVSPIFRVKSGVLFSERSIRVKKTSVNWQGPNSASLIRVTKYPNTVSFKERFRYGYISVPLTGELETQVRNFILGVYAGGSIDFSIYYLNTVKEYDEQDEGIRFVQNFTHFNALNKVVLNYVVGASLDLPVSNNAIVSFEPFITKSNDILSTPLTLKLYSYGINLSLGYKL